MSRATRAVLALLCAVAAPLPAWSDMKDATTQCRVREYKDITQNLRDEILGKSKGFLDAFYDVQSIQDAELRPLVEQSRSDTAQWFEQLRQKLQPRTCEVESEKREQSNYIIRFLINGETRVEIFVDDVYEKGGCLHVRDQIKIKLLSAK